jgi:hypothetical protein
LSGRFTTMQYGDGIAVNSYVEGTELHTWHIISAL